MSYRVVFQHGGREMETLYWNGPLDETQKLARIIALELDAEMFVISEFDGGEVYSEQCPFGGATGHRRGVRSTD